MPAGLAFIVRCNTPTEKRAFAAAAKARRITLNRFALEAMAAYGGVDLEDLRCIHCSALLSKGNGSGFCRKCQRDKGLETLRRIHQLA